MFARYSLIGALSAAFGALAAASPQYLSAAGVDQLTAIKAMFVLYALLGVGGCLLYARIPPRPPRESAVPAGALGHHATSSTGSPPSSASTRSPAASSFSRCWRCGSSSASICR